MSKEKIEASKVTVLEAYAKADRDGKDLLEVVFGKDKFKSSSDWMNVWNKFCKDNKLKVVLPHANPKDSDEEWDNSCVMLRNIFKIKRGKWKPDWNDSSQYKWFPYFSCSSGFGFEYSYSIFEYSTSYVGSRLCLPTEKLSNSVAKEFLPIFEKFHMNL